MKQFGFDHWYLPFIRISCLLFSYNSSVPALARGLTEHELSRLCQQLWGWTRSVWPCAVTIIGVLLKEKQLWYFPQQRTPEKPGADLPKGAESSRSQKWPKICPSKFQTVSFLHPKSSFFLNKKTLEITYFEAVHGIRGFFPGYWEPGRSCRSAQSCSAQL